MTQQPGGSQSCRQAVKCFCLREDFACGFMTELGKPGCCQKGQVISDSCATAGCLSSLLSLPRLASCRIPELIPTHCAAHTMPGANKVSCRSSPSSNVSSCRNQQKPTGKPHPDDTEANRAPQESDATHFEYTLSRFACVRCCDTDSTLHMQNRCYFPYSSAHHSGETLEALLIKGLNSMTFSFQNNVHFGSLFTEFHMFLNVNVYKTIMLILTSLCL